METGPILGGEIPRGYLGGGFKYFLFSSLLGEDSHFDFDSYFSTGLKPPTRGIITLRYVGIDFLNYIAFFWVGIKQAANVPGKFEGSPLAEPDFWCIVLGLTPGMKVWSS